MQHNRVASHGSRSLQGATAVPHTAGHVDQATASIYKGVTGGVICFLEHLYKEGMPTDAPEVCISLAVRAATQQHGCKLAGLDLS